MVQLVVGRCPDKTCYFAGYVAKLFNSPSTVPLPHILPSLIQVPIPPQSGNITPILPFWKLHLLEKYGLITYAIKA
jgi:hypothetical protein